MSMLLQRLIRPLRSRKVRIALVTVIAAFAAQWGLDVNDELIHTMLGMGAALILGVAHEDAGRGGGGSRSDAPNPLRP